jgi:hypothetical protein
MFNKLSTSKQLFFKLVASTTFCVFILFQNSCKAQENYTQWSNHQNDTINTTSSGAGYGISSTLTNFPYLVRLNKNNFDFSQAKGKGQDVRFATSTGTHLPYQVTLWDSAGAAAAIWIKVDQILGNNANQYIMMYWGRPTAADSSNGPAVFATSNGFAGVWHLDSETTVSDGSKTPYLDATGSGNNGKDYINGSNRRGVIGPGTYFDGSSYIQVTRPSSVYSDFSISFWVQPYSSSPVATQWYNGSGLVDGECAGVTNDFGTAYLNDMACFGTGITDQTIIGTTSLNDGKWHHVMATRVGSSGAKLLYVDGVQDASGTGSSGDLTAPPNLVFGALQTISNNFNGTLDEVQISNNVRSADWAKLSFKNQYPVPTLTPPTPVVYPDTEIILTPGQILAAPITPTGNFYNIDSLSISPALFDYLFFNKQNGVINGWANAETPRTQYIVTAYNAAGTASDTIYITAGTPSSVKAPKAGAINTPQILGLKHDRSGSASRLMYAMPAGVHSINVAIHDIRGALVWSGHVSENIAGSQVCSMPVGKSRLVGGTYFVTMNVVVANAKQIRQTKVFNLP